LLESADIDTLLFQDGIGAGNLPIELLPAYLDAIHRSTTRNRRRLQVIVELFEQLPAPPGTSATFQAVPAEITRICRQLMVAARYGKAVGFSIPEYMSPVAGPEAALLLEAYISGVL